MDDLDYIAEQEAELKKQESEIRKKIDDALNTTLKQQAAGAFANNIYYSGVPVLQRDEYVTDTYRPAVLEADAYFDDQREKLERARQSVIAKRAAEAAYQRQVAAQAQAQAQAQAAGGTSGGITGSNSTAPGVTGSGALDDVEDSRLGVQAGVPKPVTGAPNEREQLRARLEATLGRRLSDAELNEYYSTNIGPEHINPFGDLELVPTGQAQ